jgi:hypothetical protein
VEAKSSVLLALSVSQRLLPSCEFLIVIILRLSLLLHNIIRKTRTDDFILFFLF